MIQGLDKFLTNLEIITSAFNSDTSTAHVMEEPHDWPEEYGSLYGDYAEIIPVTYEASDVVVGEIVLTPPSDLDSGCLAVLRKVTVEPGFNVKHALHIIQKLGNINRHHERLGVYVDTRAVCVCETTAMNPATAEKPTGTVSALARRHELEILLDARARILRECYSDSIIENASSQHKEALQHKQRKHRSKFQKIKTKLESLHCI